MAKPKMEFTQPWGWSKLDTYRACPRQFYYKFIEKLPDPGNSAMTRGGEVHKALEMYVNGWMPELTTDINEFWTPHINRLKNNTDVKTEASWGIDSDWRPLADWFKPTTWCRAKSDVYYVKDDVLHLIDYKTGKYRVPSDDQNKLYAVIGYSMLPHVKAVRTGFWFVDQAEAPHETVYKADDLVRMRGYFNKEAGKLYKDRSFKEKPGAACRYCIFSRQKGGPCKY